MERERSTHWVTSPKMPQEQGLGEAKARGDTPPGPLRETAGTKVSLQAALGLHPQLPPASPAWDRDTHAPALQQNMAPSLTTSTNGFPGKTPLSPGPSLRVSSSVSPSILHTRHTASFHHGTIQPWERATLESTISPSLKASVALHEWGGRAFLDLQVGFIKSRAIKIDESQVKRGQTVWFSDPCGFPRAWLSINTAEMSEEYGTYFCHIQSENQHDHQQQKRLHCVLPLNLTVRHHPDRTLPSRVLHGSATLVG